MSHFDKIEILGLRGFSEKGTLNLGIPNGLEGSGLTTIVGPNNSGKSTIYESFRAISQGSPVSFSGGKRNKKADDRVELSLSNVDGECLVLKTISAGGSQTLILEKGLKKESVNLFTLPSRRGFSPFFGRSLTNRETYIKNSTLTDFRTTQLDHFAFRLFHIQEDQNKLDEFNAILVKVLGNVPSWYIDQADTGKYFVQFNYDGVFHTSDGVGEGLLSIFTIIDALYDSKEGDLIFIDEPELSLHPSYQRKLMQLFMEFSSSRQIIITTHSPYFINWFSMKNGGKITRTVKDKDGIKIYQLTKDAATELSKLIDNFNNPHIMGLDAREIFFLEDNIVLVEGQEDVIFLKRILELKGITLNGEFYGWGVGGSGNMEKIINMLKDLGFKNIAVILDNNMRSITDSLEHKFSDYRFFNIPTDDVREKKATKAKPALEGLIDQGGKKINSKYELEVTEMFEAVNLYLSH